MDVEERLPCRSRADFAAERILGHLKDLRKEIPGVRRNEDIEPLHRMRVASRRVRSALALLGDAAAAPASAGREVRTITRRLGAARDRDVQIQWLVSFREGDAAKGDHQGVDRLLLRLRQERGRLQPKLERLLLRLEEGDGIARLEEHLHRQRLAASLGEEEPGWVADARRRAYQDLGILAERLLSYEPYLSRPEAAEQHHAMRIRAKALRYGLELFSPLYDDELDPLADRIRKLQSALGEVHDGDVWVERVDRFLEEERRRALDYLGHARSLSRLVPGARAVREDRARAREEAHRKARELWERFAQEDLWGQIRTTLGKDVVPSAL